MLAAAAGGALFAYVALQPLFSWGGGMDACTRKNNGYRGHRFSWKLVSHERIYRQQGKP